jgi:hypothetical protein
MAKTAPKPFRTFFPVGESGPRGTEREVLFGLLARFPVVGDIKPKGDRGWFSFSRLSFASSLAWHDGQSGIV